MGAELDTRWFDPARTNLLVGLLLFLAFLTINILRAKRGGSIYIRPLAGLKALDEAIGRATEMGKSILYMPGLGDMSEVGTLAAITIMSRVARKVADLGCNMQVPCYDPVVMAIMDGVAREAYVEAGRGDEFKPGSVHYVSAQQFAEFIDAVCRQGAANEAKEMILWPRRLSGTCTPDAGRPSARKETASWPQSSPGTATKWLCIRAAKAASGSATSSSLS